MVIDCEKFGRLPRERLLEYLETELGLWSGLIGTRPLHSLFLLHPYRYFEPFELTRILHLVACKFQVAEEKDKKHLVIAGPLETNPDHLALLKGLGFNGYQLIVPDNQIDDTKTIAKKIRLIRDYAIECIGIQLMHIDCLGHIRQAVKAIEAQCQPDYICLGNAWEYYDVISSRGRHLLDADPNDSFDVLALGPEACSHIDELNVDNYSSCEKYSASLEACRLPVRIKN